MVNLGSFHNGSVNKNWCPSWDPWACHSWLRYTIALWTMANFNSNKWYQVTLKEYDKSNLLSLATTTHGVNGSAYFQISNNASANQQWQLFPSKDSTYVLRSGESGPYRYLVAKSGNDGSSVNTGNTVQFHLREMFRLKSGRLTIPGTWNKQCLENPRRFYVLDNHTMGRWLFRNEQRSEWYVVAL